MTLEEKALKTATAAHKGQVDKGGQPYIKHPLEVASAFQDETHIAVALLHDVIEDTYISFSDLQEYGFPNAVVDAVDAITKRSGEHYADYLDRVKQNPIARAVKLQDLKHNMQIERIQNPTERDYARMGRYKRYYQFLLDDLSSTRRDC